MTNPKNQITSNEPAFFKLVVFGLLGVVFLALGLKSGALYHYILSGVCIFSVSLELFTYSKVTLVLMPNYLSVKRVSIFKRVTEEYSIELKEIQSAFFVSEKYDVWELMQRFFLELIFPSGVSELTVNKVNGHQEIIKFNGATKPVNDFIERLPNREPNNRY